MRSALPTALVALFLMAGCGSSSAPSGVATNPPVSGGGSVAASPSSATGGGVRTVLSPLGLNIRADPSRTATRLGTAAQGAVLTVLDHTDQNGGWYKVQGQTVTGWVTADPSLTAAGTFTGYQSSDFGFSALYPQDWTFAASTTDVVFHPQNGPQTIVVHTGVRVGDFGPGGAPGFAGAGQQVVVVCGVTGDLNLYAHQGAAQPTPIPGTAGPLALLAQVRLRLDPSHALALDFNYTANADLPVFTAFYDSMTFPYPQCEQAPSAAPSPTT